MQKLSPAQALNLEDVGAWTTDDALLIPVVPDDPLLRESLLPSMTDRRTRHGLLVR
jgi:hypothetical protein